MEKLFFTDYNEYVNSLSFYGGKKLVHSHGDLENGWEIIVKPEMSRIQEQYIEVLKEITCLRNDAEKMDEIRNLAVWKFSWSITEKMDDEIRITREQAKLKVEQLADMRKVMKPLEIMDLREYWYDVVKPEFVEGLK